MDKIAELKNQMQTSLVEKHGASEADAKFLAGVIEKAMQTVAQEVLDGKVTPENSVERLQVETKRRLDEIHDKFQNDPVLKEQLKKYVLATL